MSREMKTIGENAHLVFADGNRIDYPRYRVSANGFVRGPKNEQTGRGTAAVNAAAKACTEVEQAWIDRMARFSNAFLGVTWPADLMRIWDNHNNRAVYPGFAAKGVDNHHLVVVRAFWADDIDTFDVYKLSFSRSSWGNPKVELSVDTMPLRNIPLEDAPNAIDENGTINQHYVAITGDFDTTQYERSREESPRTAIKLFGDWAEELHSVLIRDYVKYTTSIPLEDIIADVNKFLNGSEFVPLLAPHLKEIAPLFRKLGYTVVDRSTDAQLSFSITDGGEHKVVFGNSTLEVTCDYEEDEERLVRLQRMRLEHEYEESLKIHGDLTQYDVNETEDDGDD